MEGTFIEFSQHQTHFTGAPIQQSPLGTRQTTGLGMKFEPRLFANCFPLPCRSLRTDFNAFIGFLHNYLHRTMFHSRLNGYITIIIIRLTWRRPARSERMRHTFPVFQGNIRSIYIWSNYIGMCGCLRRDAPNGFCRKNSTTIKYSAISLVALKTLPPEIINWTSSVTFRKLQFLNNIEIGGWVKKAVVPHIYRLIGNVIWLSAVSSMPIHNILFPGSVPPSAHSTQFPWTTTRRHRVQSRAHIIISVAAVQKACLQPVIHSGWSLLLCQCVKVNPPARDAEWKCVHPRKICHWPGKYEALSHIVLSLLFVV